MSLDEPFPLPSSCPLPSASQFPTEQGAGRGASRPLSTRPIPRFCDTFWDHPPASHGCFLTAAASPSLLLCCSPSLLGSAGEAGKGGKATPAFPHFPFPLGSGKGLGHRGMGGSGAVSLIFQRLLMRGLRASPTPEHQGGDLGNPTAALALWMAHPGAPGRRRRRSGSPAQWTQAALLGLLS